MTGKRVRSLTSQSQGAIVRVDVTNKDPLLDLGTDSILQKVTMETILNLLALHMR